MGELAAPPSATTRVHMLSTVLWRRCGGPWNHALEWLAWWGNRWAPGLTRSPWAAPCVYAVHVTGELAAPPSATTRVRMLSTVLWRF
eukprot:284262-Prorocentrum_minimum.AAC.1